MLTSNKEEQSPTFAALLDPKRRATCVTQNPAKCSKDTAALKQYNFINLPQPQYPTRPPPLIFLISLKQSVSSRTRQQGILLIDTQAQAKQQTARLANSKTAKKSRLVDILCETTTILKVQCYNTMKNKNNYSFFVSI